MPGKELKREHFDAVLFDMDGVVTDTAIAHAAAWKRLFDDYLAERAEHEQTDARPFDANADYREFVDGKPRYDGVQSFLESRGIELPWGEPDDGPREATICGLGNRKDVFFNAWLDQNSARAIPGTVEFLQALRGAGVPMAIFSASRNMHKVLESAGLAGYFDAEVGGLKMAELCLPGKPDPAIMAACAGELGIPVDRCVVVEDAIAGVQSGRNAGVAWVIGIDRADVAEALQENGADLVVNDLSECRVDADGGIALKTTGSLVPVWKHKGALESLLKKRRLAVLLDYDGTLTPIVTDYRKAFLDDAMRDTLARLAKTNAVAVVSGRDLADVRTLVGLDSIYYSGSHGFELSGPDDWQHIHEEAANYLPDLDDAEQALAAKLADVPGHALERKHFSLAVHYRQVDDARIGEVASAVDDVLDGNTRLVKGLGKKVFELKPALPWDKGRAVALLLDTLGMARDDTVAVFIGDDITDEAAFRELRQPNVSIIVVDDDRATAADYALADVEDVREFLDWLSRTAKVTRA